MALTSLYIKVVVLDLYARWSFDGCETWAWTYQICKARWIAFIFLVSMIGLQVTKNGMLMCIMIGGAKGHFGSRWITGFHWPLTPSLCFATPNVLNTWCLSISVAMTSITSADQEVSRLTRLCELDLILTSCIWMSRVCHDDKAPFDAFHVVFFAGTASVAPKIRGLQKEKRGIYDG